MQHSETNAAPVAEENSVSSRRWGRYFVLLALLTILLWLGLKAWHIGKAAKSLLSYQTQAETMMAGGLQGINPAEVETMVIGIREDVLTLKAETAVFMPLTPYLGWVPKVGPTLVAAPELIEMADAGTETAAFAVRSLLPGLAILQDEQVSSEEQLSQLVAVLDAAKPDLNQAGNSLARVVTAREAITNVADQPSQIQTLFALADEWLPLAQDGLKFSLVLPQIAGIDGPRHYLLIAQNEDELRATGGFISGVGVLAVENGRIINLDFQDAYAVDNFDKPLNDPPAPLKELMTLDLLVFRDTNFWPDFPTSATVGMDLYSYSKDLPPLDGAIAFDQQFLQLLLQGIGPVKLQESDTSVNAQNVVEFLRSSWQIGEDENYTERKSFFGEFAQAILQIVQGDFSSLNPVQLAQNSYEAIQTKRLQIYIRDPQVAQLLDELNWDGRLENPSAQDYLMVVDTNMGFNKANLFIDRQTNYTVNLTDSSTPQSTLQINYAHNHEGAAGEPCYQGDTFALYAQKPEYAEIADQCYWNYLRVYAPSQANLATATELTVSGETLLSGQDWQSEAISLPELDELNTFANFMMVPKATSLSTEYSYTLPATILQQTKDGQNYQLFLQKQAGMKPEPVIVTIELPSTVDIVAYSPSSATINGNRVTFDLMLTSDYTISITYR
ncbi:MAG: DUF4012 domain-containing protein [Chloroflexi bacterium]|nr:MAG: DUF4012 domain-containing protein [Chloroflexota bacterium]